MCVWILGPLVKYSDGLVRASRKCCKRLVCEDIARLLVRKYVALAHTEGEAIIRKPFSCLRRTLMRCISDKKATACHIRADVPWRQIVLLPLVSMLRTRTDTVTTRRLPPKSKVHIGTDNSNSGVAPFKNFAQIFSIEPAGTNARVQLLFAEVAAR